MAVTTTFAWSTLLAQTQLNNVTPGNQTRPFIGTLEDGRWTAFWESNGETFARAMNADGTFTSVNQTLLDFASSTERMGDAARLANGAFVVAYVDHTNGAGDVEFAYYTSLGSTGAGSVHASAGAESDPSVAGLADGGFVISWTGPGGAIQARVFNADLTARTDTFTVHGATTAGQSSVTALAGGGFVVVFQEADGGDLDVKARIFDANGQAVGAAFTLDDIGSVNRDPAVLALPNGGFVVAYTDDGWNTGTTEITGRIYDADGAPTSNAFKINQPAQALNQSGVSLTLLSDNVWAAGWRTEGTNQGLFQAFDLSGAAVGALQTINDVSSLDLASANGTLMMAWEAPNGDGNGTGILGSMRSLVRTSSSDVASDTIVGDALIDVMTGGGGADTLWGMGGNDNLSGGAQNDWLFGGDGSDVLFGGTADDVLVGGAGADALDGGLNYDEASYLGAAAAVSIDLSSGVHQGEALGDTFVSVERYRLSQNADHFLAGATGVEVLGEAGDDVVFGGAGVDQLSGGDGNDILGGRQGGDVLDGGAGYDTASYGTAQSGVTVHLNGGTSLGDAAGDTFNSIERFSLSSHADTFVGGAAAEDVAGREGDDSLSGGDGDDELSGGAGDDTLFGGAGRDLADYLGTDGAVAVNLTTGNASDGQGGTDLLISIERVRSGETDDSLTGDVFANELDGGGGEDILTGLDGDDILIGGAGYNQLFGGLGNDVYRVSSASDHITEGVDEGIDHVVTDLSSLTLAANVENLTSIGTGSFLGDGNSLDNDMIGGAGTDTLWGQAGDDTLRSGGGETNTLLGGAGDDIYVVQGAMDFVIETAGEGNDTVRAGLSTYTLGAHVENLMLMLSGDNTGNGNALDNFIYGNAGGDTLNGAVGDDVLSGQGGEDVLSGGAGNDVMYGGDDQDQLFGATGQDLIGGGDGDDLIQGGADNDDLGGEDGDDSLNGGSGADKLNGGAGDDTATYYGATVAINVNLTTGAASGGWAQGDVFISIENLFGSNKADTLTGDTWLNTLNGAGGDDVIDGGSGNDALLGNGGHDLMKGGDGADLLIGGTGNDTLQGASGNDSMYGGAGADLLQGGGENDIMDGGADDDILQGAAGNDTLEGGSGADQLNGGAGSDRFEFGGGWGQDKIGDFTAGIGLNDVIAFDAAVFADLAAVMAATADDGLGNCVITKGANTLTLTGVLKADLDANDFVFVPSALPDEAPASPAIPDAFDPLVLPVGLEGKFGADDLPIVCPSGDDTTRSLDVVELGLSSFDGRDPHRIHAHPQDFAWIF